MKIVRERSKFNKCFYSIASSTSFGWIGFDAHFEEPLKMSGIALLYDSYNRREGHDSWSKIIFAYFYAIRSFTNFGHLFAMLVSTFLKNIQFHRQNSKVHDLMITYPLSIHHFIQISEWNTCKKNRNSPSSLVKPCDDVNNLLLELKFFIIKIFCYGLGVVQCPSSLISLPVFIAPPVINSFDYNVHCTMLREYLNYRHKLSVDSTMFKLPAKIVSKRSRNMFIRHNTKQSLFRYEVGSDNVSD